MKQKRRAAVQAALILRHKRGLRYTTAGFACGMQRGIDMIYIVTAIYAEAHAIITHFHLKKDVSCVRFQVFDNPEAGIRLVVTGTGMIPAAVAIADTCRRAGAGDFLVNVGTCAGIRGGGALKEEKSRPEKEASGSGGEKSCGTGQIFLCNKIKDQVTGKTFYPDILYRHEFAEGQILTGSVPYTPDKGEDGFFLYDMEAAAVYQAGLYYFGPHQMSFLKVISDDGEAEKITAEQVRELMAGNVERIAEYLNFLKEAGRREQESADFAKGVLEKEAELLCRDMHCTQTMGAALRQWIRYGILSGADIAGIREEMYRQGKLPCKDKKEGKLCFEEFKRRIL